MSALPYMPLFTRDYLADTGHLSAQESGAYLHLMMTAWQSPECRLPNDDRKLALWARVDAKTWRAIKREVMAFWTLADGHWTQRRLVKEYMHVTQVVQKRRAAAEKRWAEKQHANGYANAYPNGMHPHANAEEEKKEFCMGGATCEVSIPGKGGDLGKEGMRVREDGE